jgi:hypothetical protein
MAAGPVVRKVPFAFHSPNATCVTAFARTAGVKRTVAAGSHDAVDAAVFGYYNGAAPTMNGTLLLSHKGAVTTGDVKIGDTISVDATNAIPFTNSTLVLGGWNLDWTIYNTDAALQTYNAVFSPDEESNLRHTTASAIFDLSTVSLVVRPNDTIVFREIILFFFNSSSPFLLPEHIMLQVMTGNEQALNYPTIAVRKLQGVKTYADMSHGGLNGDNPEIVYALEHPIFLRGSDSKAGVNQSGIPWSPFLYANFPAASHGPNVGYLFEVVGELYQNANRSVAYQGG